MLPVTDAMRTLKIFAAADRGMAMGHLDGKVAFVPFAAPGDVVEVQVVREKRRYVETRLVRILEPSPTRRPARCPHFGVCGGCQWQHLPYPDQLDAKARSFRGLLRSRLRLAEDRFLTPLASPTEWGYRNRVGWKVRQVGGTVRVGYFARGTHRLVALGACPVAHPAIQSLLPRLTAFFQGFAPARGHLPQVDVQVDGEERLWAVFHRLRPFTPGERSALEGFLESESLAGAALQGGRKSTLEPLGGRAGGGKMTFRIQVGSRALSLAVSPGGFVQANPGVNQALVDAVADLAPLYRGRDVVDLYCGAGNFTLPLALAARRVVGVEGYPPAAADAADNARRNGLPEVRTLAAPVPEGLEQLIREGFRPWFALLDPPREGAADAVTALGRLAPAHILYVSCSPATLTRDLHLLQGQGYRVEWTRMADMFPQTAHVESLTLLGRAL
ncbi:MAG: 23S rRNA (uracil(1939)-C(5))-methyltransferase RlmD [Deferrisomatales bacterium]